MTGYAGLKIVVGYGDTLVTGGYTVIGYATDINPPALQSNFAEVTNRQSTGTASTLIEEYVPTTKFLGDITLGLVFDESETTHGSASGLMSFWDAQTKKYYHFYYPDGSEWVVAAYVANIAPKGELKGAQMADVTLKPTGQILFNDG